MYENDFSFCYLFFSFLQFSISHSRSFLTQNCLSDSKSDRHHHPGGGDDDDTSSSMSSKSTGGNGELRRRRTAGGRSDGQQRFSELSSYELEAATSSQKRPSQGQPKIKQEKFDRKRRIWKGVEKYVEAKSLMETLSKNFHKHINNEVCVCAVLSWQIKVVFFVVFF